MITLVDYWNGRDSQYPAAMTSELVQNAVNTVKLANLLLNRAVAAGVELHKHPLNRSLVASGWRPPAVNAATPGAAPNSKHITGIAIDIYDPDGDLDEWLMTQDGQLALMAVGLWLEHPSATKSWSHLQTVAPRSGNRVFYP